MLFIEIIGNRNEEEVRITQFCLFHRLNGILDHENLRKGENSNRTFELFHPVKI